MRAIQFLALVVLSLIHHPQMVGDGLDEETHVRTQLREEMLRWHMTRRLKEVGELEKNPQGECSLQLWTQEQRSFLWGAVLLLSLQQWQFYAIVSLLVLPLRMCVWLIEMISQLATRIKEDDFINKSDIKVEEVKDCRVSDLPASFPIVSDLVDDLLLTCLKLSENSFMPQIWPAVETRTNSEGWSPSEVPTVESFLVLIEPPRGHSFCIKMSREEEMLVRKCQVLVELECTCQGKQLVEDMLCFLHHPEKELRLNQAPSLLDTLCAGNYLDIEDTVHWFQWLVAEAWVLLPESRHCQLTVLPSMRSCRLRVRTSSGRALLIEMILGVQHNTSDTFLTIE
ncbi:inositol 1,4,5-trisphosphate receptor-interacting protein-like 1 [Heliangelus exortis]|uniref:inositol 1,4,5-trisphosphate receptor-interacting protein-like 1 n=1 Tax=Heliangelus exortis TaxID=472823 RepID=UPI003A8D49F6